MDPSNPEDVAQGAWGVLHGVLEKVEQGTGAPGIGAVPRVGKKTSAIINLFDCNNPDMAVDTHVFRYAQQLGWAPSEELRARHNKGSGTAWPAITRDTVYAHLDANFPDNLKYSMHLILTDTEGGLLVVCGARNHLGFDKRGVTVDGKPLKEVVKEHEL